MQDLEYIDKYQEILTHDISNIRIMTYNVHGFKNKHNEKKIDEIINIISKINPQILIIEEVYVFVRSKTITSLDLTILLKKKGFEHITFSKNGINLVCSKYKFISRELDLGKDQIRGIYRNALICTFPDLKDLVVIGTHLDVFDNTGNTRIKQINKIINELNINQKENKSYILTGDFNSMRKKDYNEIEWDFLVKTDIKRKVNLIEDVIPVIENLGFIDSFQASSKSLKVSVWSGRRVDYIYGKNITFIQTDSYRSTVSDHYPVYADISI